MKQTEGPKSDFVFNRKVTAADKWLVVNAQPKGYDLAFVNDRYRPAVAKWVKAYGGFLDKDNRTRAVTIAKNAAKKELMPLYLELVRMIKGNAMTSDEDRILLEITPNAKVYHPKVPVTKTAPFVKSDTSLPGRVTFEYWELDAKDGSKAMPHGAGSFEFWYSILDHVPVHINELTIMLIDFQTPLVIDFDASDRGKTLYFVARWVSPTGEKGPWTVITMVIVP